MNRIDSLFAVYDVSAGDAVAPISDPARWFARSPSATREMYSGFLKGSIFRRLSSRPPLHLDRPSSLSFLYAYTPATKDGRGRRE